MFIVQSPGIVFLTTDDPTSTLADKLMEALMSCGPLVLFSFLIAYLAGVVMWVLVRDVITNSCHLMSVLRSHSVLDCNI